MVGLDQIAPKGRKWDRAVTRHSICRITFNEIKPVGGARVHKEFVKEFVSWLMPQEPLAV